MVTSPLIYMSLCYIFWVKMSSIKSIFDDEDIMNFYSISQRYFSKNTEHINCSYGS